MSDNVERTLGRIEGALQAIDEKLDAQHVRQNNHGTRLASLENWKSKLIGIATAAGVVGSLLAKVLL